MNIPFPSDLKLYQKNGACSFVPHALLEYLQVPYTVVRMIPGTKGYKPMEGMTREEYLKEVHPRGYVPALSIRDEDARATVITENPAIMTFICNLVPGHQLRGTTAMEKAQVAEWLAFLAGTVHGYGAAMIWRPERFTDCTEDRLRDSITQKGRSVLVDGFERIEERVGDDGFAVGGRLTVADFYLTWFWHVAEELGFDPISSYPRLRKIVHGVIGLSAVKAVMDTEGLKMEA